MNKLLGSNIKNAVFVNTTISAFAILLQLLLIAFASRINPEYVAIIGVIELVASITFAISFFGGEQYFINFNNKNNNINSINILALVLILLFVMSFVMYFILLLLFFSGLITIDLPIIMEDQFFLLYFISIFTAFSFAIAGFFRTNLRFLLGIVCEKMYIVIFSFSTIVYLLLFKNFEPEKLYYFSFVSSIISLLLVFLILLKYNFFTHQRLSLLDIKEFKLLFRNYFTKEGAFFYLTTILILVYERIDQVFVVGLFGMTALAGYYASYKISFAVRFITKSINTVVYPYMSKLQNNDEKDKSINVYKLNRNVNFLISLLFSTILFFFSEYILRFFYAETFIDYEFVLEIMAVVLLFSSLNQVDFNFLNTHGKSDLFFINSVLTVTVQLLTIGLLVSSLGVVALVLSRLFAVMVGSIYAYWHIRKFNKNIIPLIISLLFFIQIIMKVLNESIF